MLCVFAYDDEGHHHMRKKQDREFGKRGRYGQGVQRMSGEAGQVGVEGMDGSISGSVNGI